MLVSLFNIELNIDKEYIPLINDVIRMFIIQVVAHALFVVNNKNVGFFDKNFLQMLIFILLGIATYWMIVRKIVIIN